MNLHLNQRPLVPLCLVLVAFFALPPQLLSSALDITTLPTTTSNISKRGTVDLPGLVPSFTYRVLVNDYFHLNCQPSTVIEVGNVEEAIKEVQKNDGEKKKGCFDQPEDTAPLYVSRSEADVAFFGGQQLRLLQKRSLGWEVAGNNFSLTALYRERQMKERNVLTSGLFEEVHLFKDIKDPEKVPQYICRSVGEPEKVGLFSLSDGICRTQKAPENGNYNSNWTFMNERNGKFQLATKLRQDLNYSWVEVTTSQAVSGQWIPPPNAVEVDIGGTGRDHLPLYIVRLKVNSTFTTVMSLKAGTSLPPTIEKLELLVVDEVLFQVCLCLSGRVHPLSGRANRWDEMLNCKLKINNTSTSSSSSSAGEVKIVHLKMDNNGAAIDAFGDNRKNKVTSWQIFRKSTATSPYWGIGHGGSLFPDDPVFMGHQGTNFRFNDRDRLPRHLCKLKFGYKTHRNDHWRGGFLDHRKGECIVSTGWFTDSSTTYEVLYSGGNFQKFTWTPYRQAHAQELGAITAGFKLDEEDKQVKMFFARLPNFKDPDDGNRTVSLYGTIFAGTDKFYYQTGEYIDSVRELEGAETAGVQVLALV